MPGPRRQQERGPEPIGDILARLFTARGWGRRQERLQLDQAWVEAVGPEFASRTRTESLRRGVLEVVVGNAVLLQILKLVNKRPGRDWVNYYSH